MVLARAQRLLLVAVALLVVAIVASRGAAALAFAVRASSRRSPAGGP